MPLTHRAGNTDVCKGTGLGSLVLQASGYAQLQKKRHLCLFSLPTGWHPYSSLLINSLFILQERDPFLWKTLLGFLDSSISSLVQHSCSAPSSILWVYLVSLLLCKSNNGISWSRKKCHVWFCPRALNVSGTMTHNYLVNDSGEAWLSQLFPSGLALLLGGGRSFFFWPWDL